MKLQNSNYNSTLLLFVLFLAITSCSKPERKVDFQGHRGARGLYPENSLEGFEYALSIEELTTLELDIVVSADKNLIVSHEPWLNPEICDFALTTDPKNFNLYSMTTEEIQAFDCGSKGHPKFPDQKAMATYKPTLSELFNLLSHTGNWRKLNIEPKSRPVGDGVYHPKPKEFARLIATFLERYDALNPEFNLYDLVTIQSFDVRTLQELRKLHTGVKLCLLTEDETDPAAAMDKLGFPADIYGPSYETVTPEIVNWCHFRRIDIVPWTVNEVADMQRLLDMGVDGLISDYPNKYKELVY
ncbi:MAG: glycerophosphodiester phosphodiesterase family protein [Schleiferiaceae bacterium]